MRIRIPSKQLQRKQRLLTSLLVGAVALGSFTTLMAVPTWATGCGCEAAVCSCDDVSCGCETPVCGCEPVCGFEEPACGLEAACGIEPACGLEPTCGLGSGPICGCEEPVCGCDSSAGDCGGDFGIFDSLRKRKASCGLEAACGCEQPACGIEEPACGCGEVVCGVEEPACGCDVCAGIKIKRPNRLVSSMKSAAGKLRGMLKFRRKATCDSGCFDGCDAAMIEELNSPMGAAIPVPPTVVHPHAHAPHAHRSTAPLPPPLVVRPSAPTVQRSAPMLQRSAPMLQRSAPMLQRSAPAIQRSAPMLQRSAPAIQRSAPTMSRGVPVVPTQPRMTQPRMSQPRLVPSNDVVIDSAPSTEQSTRMPIEVKPAAPSTSARQPSLEPAPLEDPIRDSGTPAPVPDSNSDDRDDNTDQFFKDMQDPFSDDEVRVRRYQPVRPSNYVAPIRSSRRSSARTTTSRTSNPQTISNSGHRTSRRNGSVR